MIGIKDINGIEIEEGHEVEVRVKTWNGTMPICRGKIEFRGEDLSSFGCGYGVVDSGKITFLSGISKSSTEIEVMEE